MPSLDLRVLNPMLESVDARWRAAEPPAEHHLGFVPGPGDHSLEQREQIAFSSHRSFIAMSAAMAAAPPAYPPAIDWRLSGTFAVAGRGLRDAHTRSRLMRLVRGIRHPGCL